MLDVITIGSGTVDAFVETKDRLFGKASVKENDLCHVPFGSKIVVDGIRYDIGGGGTNTAVAFRRLGLDTAWLGKTGTDMNSKKILELLKKEKINTRFVCTGETNAGYSIILDASGHDRTILTFKGSNNELSSDDIVLKKLKARWFYFSSMMQESFRTSVKIVKFAEEKGIKIAFNPSSYQVSKGSSHLKPILSRTDILIFNKEEAGILVGDDNIRELLKKANKLGPKIVVITDGRNGAYCFDGNMFYRVKAHNIKVIESTGAGDAFAASFVTAIIKGRDIQTALRWGIANSQSVIRHYGAKNKLLSMNQLLKELRENPVEVKGRF